MSSDAPSRDTTRPRRTLAAVLAVALLLSTTLLAFGAAARRTITLSDGPGGGAGGCGRTEFELGDVTGTAVETFTGKGQNDTFVHEPEAKFPRYTVAAQGGAPLMHAGIEVNVHASNVLWLENRSISEEEPEEPTRPFIKERCEEIFDGKVGYAPELIEAPNWTRYVYFYVQPNQDGIEFAFGGGGAPWLWTYEIAAIELPETVVQ